VETRKKLEVLESTSGDTGKINLWRTEEISHEKCDYLFALLVTVVIVPKFMVTHTQTHIYKFFLSVLWLIACKHFLQLKIKTYPGRSEGLISDI
jgi:hypothetical protein